MLDQPIISSLVLTSFCDLVRDLGGKPADLLEAAGIAVSQHLVGQSIVFRDFTALLESAAEITGCLDFGVRLSAKQLTIGPQRLPEFRRGGTIGDLIRSCSHLMNACGTAIQTHLERFPDSDNNFILIYSCLADGVAYRRQASEYLLAITNDDIKRLSRDAAGMTEEWFAHEALAPAATYRQRFGCTVRFSEPFDAAIWNEHDLRQKLECDDPPNASNELGPPAKHLPERSPFSSHVRRVIDRQVHGDACTRHTTAATLGLHPRTMHRWLSREGTNFEALRDRVRRELASRYIAQSNVPFTEIAARLGFSEPAVLSRACRRWFGFTPSELRRGPSPSLAGRTVASKQ